MRVAAECQAGAACTLCRYATMVLLGSQQSLFNIAGNYHIPLVLCPALPMPGRKQCPRHLEQVTVKHARAADLAAMACCSWPRLKRTCRALPTSAWLSEASPACSAACSTHGAGHAQAGLPPRLPARGRAALRAVRAKGSGSDLNPQHGLAPAAP